MNFKIQSISDIITNSSTSVITIYRREDLNTIKYIVNSILAVNSDYKFDDLFKIKLSVSDWKLEELYDRDEEISNRFKSFEEFNKYINTEATQEELDDWDERYGSMGYYDNSQSIYDGYYVQPREDHKGSTILEKAARAISQMDNIFEHDSYYNG